MMTTMASLADASPSIALGPLDGRYRAVVAPLVDHLSEAALNRQRVHVEVEWLIHLTTNAVVPGVRALTADEQRGLRAVVEDFGPGDVAELAEIERETVHDVKAVEYFLRRRLPGIAGEDETAMVGTSGTTGIAGIGELIHFGCTSEDINNLCYALMVKGAVEQVWLPRATALVDAVSTLATDLRDVPLLARTHGQPATPTTMGKEIAVLAFRLSRQLGRIGRAEYLGKLNGATGTYGAHVAAVPGDDSPARPRAPVWRTCVSRARHSASPVHLRLARVYGSVRTDLRISCTRIPGSRVHSPEGTGPLSPLLPTPASAPSTGAAAHGREKSPPGITPDLRPLYAEASSRIPSTRPVGRASGPVARRV